ncbi:AP4B1 [Branchiostoma lanceolatum]|uniref:AP complex subunit beta n=1 Tax=Branchiostoma lanceolatum TaxID=7740 RepID=A0A8K0ABQ1_BRALA|nr:AP4B1 [Branchiostoma lanceolatum]
MPFFAGNDTIKELRTALADPAVQADKNRYRQVLRRVVSLMTDGADMSPLFPDIIKASATSDLVQKKLTYLYICNYAAVQQDLALLAVNTLQKDCLEPNPMVRGLALRTMCSLRIPSLVEYIQMPLKKGLQDSSAYVRRNAVNGCAKMLHVAPEIIQDAGVINQLYGMIRDKDPIVVVNCLQALEEILQAEGGVVVNKNIAHYLLNRVQDFSEWGQCQVLHFLLKYKPSEEEETFDIMNIVDVCLKHSNSGVIMAALKYFLFLTQDMPQIQEQVYNRAKSPLLNIITSGGPELSYVALCHIQYILKTSPGLFNKDFKKFFCRYNDPLYVKTKKLQVLTEMATDGTENDIVEELSMYCTDVSNDLATASIQAIGKIARRLPTSASHCVGTLLKIHGLQQEHITSAVLMALKDLVLLYPDIVSKVTPLLPNCVDLVQEGPAKATLVWMMGQYGHTLPNGPYILEDMVENVASEISVQVKLELLTATAKMFFNRPAECQDMLGRLLEYCIDEDTNMAVRDRALMYYRLLHTDVQQARRVILGAAKRPVQIQDSDAPGQEVIDLKDLNTLVPIYGRRRWDVMVEERRRKEDQTKLTNGTSDNTDMGAKGGEEDNLETLEETIYLVSHYNLTPQEFETKWEQLDCVTTVHLDYNPTHSPNGLLQKLEGAHIFTMASSPEDATPWNAFLFAVAEMKDQTHLVLVELCLDRMAATMQATCKFDADQMEDAVPLISQFGRVFRGTITSSS